MPKKIQSSDKRALTDFERNKLETDVKKCDLASLTTHLQKAKDALDNESVLELLRLAIRQQTRPLGMGESEDPVAQIVEHILQLQDTAGERYLNAEDLALPATKYGDANSNIITSCVSRGNPAVVAVLLRFGADAQIPFNNGYTIAMLAAMRGNTEVLRVIVNYLNIDGINAVSTNRKTTALMEACGSDNKVGAEECVALLLQKGADVNHKNKDGQTALDIAKANNNGAAVRLIQDAVSGDALEKGTRKRASSSFDFAAKNESRRRSVFDRLTRKKEVQAEGLGDSDPEAPTTKRHSRKR
jgi:hypothetical protein